MAKAHTHETMVSSREVPDISTDFEFDPKSVEAGWSIHGTTKVDVMGFGLDNIQDSDVRNRYARNILMGVHVAMNGHVGDRATTPSDRLKIMRSFLLGLSDNPEDDFTQQAYAWYEDAQSEKDDYHQKSRGEVLDDWLDMVASQPRAARFLDLKSGDAVANHPNVYRARAAAFIATNAYEIANSNPDFFIKLMTNAQQMHGDRFIEARNVADNARGLFIERVEASGLSEYVNLHYVRAIAEGVDIAVQDPGTAIGRDHSFEESPQLGGMAYAKTGKIRVLEDYKVPLSEDMITHITSHELMHMISKKEKMGDAKISTGFSYPISETDGFDGTVFNEGMTESLTETLIEDYEGIYANEVSVLNEIFGTDEKLWDQALRLYFGTDGTQSSADGIIALIDSVLGKGAARSIDQVYRKAGAEAALSHTSDLRHASIA